MAMAAPSTVAKRLTDLLHEFPQAAIGGVPWSVLVRKYEERFTGTLDLAAMGHSSALAAASTLLWDVFRKVDGGDPQKIHVAMEDAATLVARPGFMASWPSIYQCLCDVVRSSGSVEMESTSGPVDGPVYSLLLSQLKPLLQSHWHSRFEENVSFLKEDGSTMRFKKMKHMVTAVLKWRDLRVEWRRASGQPSTAIDHALRFRLELVASTSHNDLVVRCYTGCAVDESESFTHEEQQCQATAHSLQAHAEALVQPHSAFAASAAASSSRCQDAQTMDLASELAFLRAENAALRAEHVELMKRQSNGTSNSTAPGSHISDSETEAATEISGHVPGLHSPMPGFPIDIADEMSNAFDDPYEPPPQSFFDWSSTTTSTPSCISPRNGAFSASSGVTTNVPMTPVTLHDLQGAATAAPMFSEQVCAFVPVWVSFAHTAAGLGDRCAIPAGIVQRVRTQIESLAGPDSKPPMP